MTTKQIIARLAMQFLIVILFSVTVRSQPVETLLYTVLNERSAIKLKERHFVERFYASNNFELAWIPRENKIALHNLLYKLANYNEYGIDDIGFDNLIQNVVNASACATLDSVILDVKLTDAAFYFLKSVKFGKQPAFRYTGVSFQPDKELILKQLLSAATDRNFSACVEKLEPRKDLYRDAKNLLAGYLKTYNDPSFKEIIIRSTAVSAGNTELIIKLKQLGTLPAGKIPTTPEIITGLTKAQRMFDLLPAGKISSTTLKALNVPLSRRITELKKTVNAMRWIDCLQDRGEVAIVNLPSGGLFFYRSDSVLLFSKIVAGKPSSPTPSLTSRITEVIVYPYWNVPYKIATREILPRIKRSISYLNDNNYQVLNKAGKQVNPYSINWQSLSASNFPYSIRQATGCDNSLGLLKFNFYNPFTVYLHDTPSKGLFALNKRFFSHGCMRVEKPVDLASVVLKRDQERIDSLTAVCLRDQRPETIRLSRPIPVVVLYSTAWHNETGELVFFDDIYRKL